MEDRRALVSTKSSASAGSSTCATSDETAPLIKRALHCKTANGCATKSSATHGMIDVALLSSNASQLKHVLELGEAHKYYTLVVALISVSIAVQVLAALINLVVCCAYNLNNTKDEHKAHLYNYALLWTSGFITVINLAIATFDGGRGYWQAAEPESLLTG